MKYSSLELHNLSRQLQTLLELIYETKNCRVIIADDGSWVRFLGRNNGTINRGDGVHGAAMPALHFALGDKRFRGCNSLEIGHEMPNDVVVRINDAGGPFKRFLNLEEVRDALLEYELGRFLISAQNAEYFATHKDFHPRSGSGATRPKNLCLPMSDLLNDSSSIKVVSSGGINLLVRSPSEEVKYKISDMIDGLVSSKDKESRHFSRLKIDHLLFTPQGISKLLSNLKMRKINYQGIIPISAVGSIYMANRRNVYENMGYATAGGHCSEPYHSEVGALFELGDEFSLELNEEGSLGDVVILDRDEGLESDAAIFVIDDEFLQLSVEAAISGASLFQVDAHEFELGSERVLSFKEMRDRKMPLRNIRSLEVYLEYNAKKIQSIIDANPSFAGVSCKIPSQCLVHRLGSVKFPNADFGVINFYSTDPIALKLTIDDIFGGGARVDVGKGLVALDNLNPKQVIGVLEGKITKDEILAYRKDQRIKAVQFNREKSAIDLIKNFFKRNKSRAQTIGFLKRKGATSQDSLKEVSKLNLQKVQSRLTSAELLPFVEREELARERGDGSILTPAEERLFEALCNVNYYLDHATFSEGLAGIKKSGLKMLDRVEMVRRGLTKKESAAFASDGSVTMGQDVFLEESGVDQKIFFTVGTSKTIPHYLTQETSQQAVIRVECDKLFLRKADVLKMHVSEIWTRFFREESTAFESDIGDTKYIIHYLTDYVEGGMAKIHQFRRSDGSNIEQKIKMGEDLCCAEDMIGFFAYIAIERLRYIGGETRRYLLENPHDAAAVERFASRIISNLNFIAYIPVELDLNKVSAQIIDKDEAVAFRKELFDAIRKNDPEALTARLLIRLDPFYICNIAGGINMELVIPKVDVAILEILIDNGFFEDIVIEKRLSNLSGIKSLCLLTFEDDRVDLLRLLAAKNIITPVDIERIVEEDVNPTYAAWLKGNLLVDPGMTPSIPRGDMMHKDIKDRCAGLK